MTARRVTALLALLVLLLAPAARAAIPKVEFYDIEDELMCVTCNVPLNIAESAQADDERAEIKRLIAEGKTKQQIKDQLVEEFGPNVLAQPKADGFNLVAWLVPIAATLGLIGLGLVLLPRWRANRDRRLEDEPALATPPALDDADAQRLALDMERSGL